nr:glycosyltransferase [Nannocystis sp. ILAH1]
MISAICPTYARSDRHALLYEAFLHQDHADSELLVLDDSPEPSSFFLALDDPRVCYEHLPVRQSIGAKRNMLVARARGEVVVHFDDDDYYAPDYLARMAEALADDDFVTLGEWHAWQEATATMWRWDTTRVDAAHAHVSRTGYRWIEDMAAHIGGMAAYVDVDGFVESTSWGFGFSYGYRRLVWQECPFPDRNHGEDYVFSRHARTRGYRCRILSGEAWLGRCVHVVHVASPDFSPRIAEPAERPSSDPGTDRSYGAHMSPQVIPASARDRAV